jgi:ABC-type multidrug transport system fused ATPase/permease subunit
MSRAELIKRIIRLCGPKVMLLFGLTIPLGLLQGILEIVFGFALLNFLRHFQLVASQHVPLEFLFSGFHPVWLLLGIGFIRTAVASASMIVNNTTYEAFNVILRKRLALDLLQQPETLRLSVADTSNMMSNLLPRSATFMNNLSILAIQMVMILITLAGLLRLSPPLTLLAGITVLLFGLPVLFTKRLLQEYSSNVYANTKHFSDRFLRGIRNLEFLRIIDKTSDEADALVGINRVILKDCIRYICCLTANSMWPQFSAVCVIILVVLANIRHAWVPGVVLIPFVYLLSRITAGVGEIIRALGTMQFNWPFLHGLVILFPLKASVRLRDHASVDGSISPGFSVQNLTVQNLSIGRDKMVYLTKISFKGDRGDFICFQGESGRGKTTLLMTLIGLLPQKGGQILWNGNPVQSLVGGWFKGRVAYSGADPFLLDTSIRDNVLLGNEHHRYADQDIWRVFDIAECSFVRNLPGQLDYCLLEGGEGISAGQKQRLSIARALLRKPEVLLLDEATANVDVETEESIINDIRNQFPQLLVLAVSHRESMMKFATFKMAL